jgi:Leucine-rich repeat (LRR) protein
MCYKRKEKWYLDCSLVEIDALPIGIPVNTSRMWLSGQSLTDIGVTNFLPPLPKLRELLLNGNPITNISANAFQNVTGLRMLLLHYTQIRTLPTGVFDNMKKLRYLWINDAEVTTIEGENAFSDLERVEELRLSGNNISSFHSGQFKKLPAIRELKLDNNADLFSGDLSSSCCAMCGVKQVSVQMNQFKNESVLDDDRRLVCDYNNLQCKNSTNQDICGEGIYVYKVSSSSTLFSIAGCTMAISALLIASSLLTL